MPYIPPHSYSHHITGQRILIIGRTLPVLGGVAVHVERVAHQLRQQKNTVELFDNEAVGRWRHLKLHLIILFFKMLIFQPQRVYYHTSYLVDSQTELSFLWWVQPLFLFQLFFVEHNCRHLYTRDQQFIATFKQVLERAHGQILIGSLTYKSFYDADLLHRDLLVESAFLPPDLTHEHAVLATYPPELFLFLKKYPLLMVANAAGLVKLHGKDLYGFDACIAAVADMHKIDARVGCVLALANIGDADYYHQLCAKIKEHGVQDAIFFLHDQKELWPLIKRADLFVRPTLSDGASVSVEEALYFKVQTVASDVCMRPDDVKVFNTGDQEDFIEKVKEVLYGISTEKQCNYLHAQPTSRSAFMS